MATTTSSPGEVQAILARGGARLRARMRASEERLRGIMGEASGPLAAHASSIVAAGGKRLRPLLVLLSAHAAEGTRPDGATDEDALVRAAVSVELVHSATLVHDDVLDDAPLRRGRPTVVAAGGRGLATAAGDLLFARAFAELVRSGNAAQLQALSDASSALAVGELYQREDAYRVDVPLERYLERCELKTARLFEAAARLGVLAVTGDDDAPSSPTRSRPMRAASGSRSSCSTTCSTWPATPGAPASAAARTCSTGRSRCRSSSPASATRRSRGWTFAP